VGKGLSIKDFRTQEGVFQRGGFEDKGGLQLRTSALLRCKKFGICEIYGLSARTGGRSYTSADIDRRRVDFRVFVRMSYGRPLIVT